MEYNVRVSRVPLIRHSDWEIPMVDCPVHGRQLASKDVENGGCSVCSEEFHIELLGMPNEDEAWKAIHETTRAEIEHDLADAHYEVLVERSQAELDGLVDGSEYDAEINFESREYHPSERAREIEAARYGM